MASSQDGKSIFLAVKDSIYVFSSADFSSNNPPEPATFFPFNPLLVLRPTQDQVNTIRARCSRATPIQPGEIVFNHIRAGWIGDCQESLVAVGEFGTILVWNVGKLEDGPVLLEGSNDFESTWGIAISSNNLLIATSSNAHAVTLFHFPSKRVIFSGAEGPKIHLHNIPSLDFSPCGRWVASCSIDGQVAVWSLINRQVTRFDSKLNGWGWLVRFVSPEQYTHIGKTVHFHSNTKRVYTSNIRDDTENDSPYEEMATLGRYLFNPTDRNDVAEIAEDEFISEADGSESEFETEYEHPSEFETEAAADFEPEAPRNSHSPSSVPVLDATRLLQEILAGFETPAINNEGQIAHLAEGAGDTWPTDPEDQVDEEEDDSDAMSKYVYNTDPEDSYDDYFSENSSTDESQSEKSLSDKSYSDEESYDSDDSEYAGRLNTVKFEIKFILTDGISLFPLSSKISVTEESTACPYDVIYCTRESFSIISPSDSWLKMKIKDLTEYCMLHQKIPKGPYSLNMAEMFLKRLCMGEWLNDLGSFIVIDSLGHLITLSPKVDGWRSQTLDSVIVPDVRVPRSEIVGYTTVRKVDAEYGGKVHVYLLCADGTFRLYEILKKSVLF